MSSAEEDAARASKKRKLQRACDYCRRKKIKCDGPQMPNNRCSKCIAHRTECTYIEGVQRSGYPSSYVEDLESRLERMEQLMSKLVPNPDMSEELESHRADEEAHASETPASHASTSRASEALDSVTGPSTFAVTPRSPGSDDFYPSDEEEEVSKVTEELRKLSVSPQPYRYHGKSSSLLFIRSVLALKDHRVSSESHGQEQDHGRHPWLRPTIGDGKVPGFDDYPPVDLIDILVNLYFRNVNDHLPLLHEPTFKTAVKDGLHLRDSSFGATVLLVCANASRFTRDPRVLMDGSDHPQSAGWRWFQQVDNVRKTPLAPAQLYDLQIYVLMIFFLQGTTAPQATWTLIGIGIRIALDVGAHRKRMYSDTPTVEEELWRRAFWILVVSEWSMGHGLGRPYTIHDEDIDLDLPTECDDEYWTDASGKISFSQPAGKPSKISFFNHCIRLFQILASATRTIYSTNKLKAKLGHGGQEWEQRAVAELDSALNKWVDSLPEHLRWDPNREDLLFLSQSASLFSQYYTTQIAVHRPFMSSAHRDSPLSFPSLIICTNAARSSIQVLEVLYKRTGSPYSRNMGSLFTSGICLMMSVLIQIRSGRPLNMNKDLAYVEKCVEMLKALRFEMHISEALGEIVGDLMSVAKTSLAQQQTLTTSQGSGAATQARVALSSMSSTRGAFDPREHPSNLDVSHTRSVQNSAVSDSITPATLLALYPHTAGPLHPNVTPSALPLRTEQLTQIPLYGFGTTTNDTVQQRSLQQNVPPVSAFSHSAAVQSALPSYPQVRDVTASQFDFGPDPLGYGDAASFLPTMMPNAESSRDPLAPAGTTDEEMPEFAFIMDNTLTMWSNAPPSFEWGDWGAYVNHMNNSDV